MVIAKNANVATGEQGHQDAEEIRRGRRPIGVPVEEVLIASTGVIGRPYPMDLLRSHLAGLAGPGLTPTRSTWPGP